MDPKLVLAVAAQLKQAEAAAYEQEQNQKFENQIPQALDQKYLDHFIAKWGENTMLMDGHGNPLGFAKGGKFIFCVSSEGEVGKKQAKVKKILYDSLRYQQKHETETTPTKALTLTPGFFRQVTDLKNELSQEKQKNHTLELKLKDPLVSLLANLLEREQFGPDAPFYSYCLFFVQWLDKGTTSFNKYPEWIVDLAISIQYLGGKRMLEFLRGDISDPGI